jgi:hypothetical protein
MLMPTSALDTITMGGRLVVRAGKVFDVNAAEHHRQSGCATTKPWNEAKRLGQSKAPIIRAGNGRRLALRK